MIKNLTVDIKGGNKLIMIRLISHQVRAKFVDEHVSDSIASD